MDMDNSEGTDYGSGGVGWVEGGKWGKWDIYNSIKNTTSKMKKIN